MNFEFCRSSDGRVRIQDGVDREYSLDMQCFSGLNNYGSVFVLPGLYVMSCLTTKSKAKE